MTGRRLSTGSGTGLSEGATSQGGGGGGVQPAWWGAYDAAADPEPAPGRITPANCSRAERRRSRSATPTHTRGGVGLYEAPEVGGLGRPRSC
eukprot:3108625-Rhodomonas_salina.1